MKRRTFLASLAAAPVAMKLPVLLRDTPQKQLARIVYGRDHVTVYDARGVARVQLGVFR